MPKNNNRQSDKTNMSRGLYIIDDWKDSNIINFKSVEIDEVTNIKVSI